MPTDMTISAAGRGKCSRCGKDLALRGSGLVRSHTYGDQPCPGSGQLPGPDALRYPAPAR